VDIGAPVDRALVIHQHEPANYRTSLAAEGHRAGFPGFEGKVRELRLRDEP